MERLSEQKKCPVDSSGISAEHHIFAFLKEVLELS